MLEEQIQMVDLHGQYLRFKEEIDEAMQVAVSYTHLTLPTNSLV